MHLRQQALSKALEHIQKNQLPDGSFLNLSSSDSKNFSNAITRKTLFTTANIITCLQAAQKNAAQEIIRKGIGFLLSQKSKRSSFNYWPINTQEYTALPYPDDLDDTCAAWATIYQYDKDLLSGSDLANIVTLLTSAETSPGGPFKTWISSHFRPTNWDDVDIIVNSTVGYFLAKLAIHLPQMEKFMVEKLQRDDIISRYYPNKTHALYFLARYITSQRKVSDASKNILLKRVGDHAAAIKNGDNLLEKAMIISTLADLAKDATLISDLSNDLIYQIQKNGFQTYPFCIDPAIMGKRYYCGASTITAAFCFEALSKYKNTSKEFSPNRATEHNRIRAVATKSATILESPLKENVLFQIEKNRDQKITALPYEIQSILKEKNIFIPDNLVDKLSLATLYGWMAYTLQDKVIDEVKDIEFIPCANYFFRQLLILHEEIDQTIPGTKKIICDLLNAIDNANVWEYKHCRIPSRPNFGDYANLANRSIGYAIGPLIILFSLGYETNSAEYKTIQLALQNYLIARQFHDDAHDWEEDLNNSKVNSVSALIFKDLLGNPSIFHMKETFRNTTINVTSSLIIFHADLATHHLNQSVLLRNTPFLKSELHRLMVSAQTMTKERDKIVDFLNNYQQNPLSSDIL